MRDYVIMIHVRSDNARMVEAMGMDVAEFVGDYAYDIQDTLDYTATHVIPDRTISAADIASEKEWGNAIQEFMDSGHNVNPLPENFPNL